MKECNYNCDPYILFILGPKIKEKEYAEITEFDEMLMNCITLLFSALFTFEPFATSLASFLFILRAI